MHSHPYDTHKMSVYTFLDGADSTQTSANGMENSILQNEGRSYSHVVVKKLIATDGYATAMHRSSDRATI